uniref:Translation initiation factor IF-2, chloroplastic n=1 Tax=Melanthalia intermedia TaxID=172989 RepID=A0A345UAR6_9FLOR|nr:translation initiation factor 2 [Melanthalia intermedia]AXI97552.1 translation initiation factor 2 [Melanthalia intermedia]
MVCSIKFSDVKTIKINQGSKSTRPALAFVKQEKKQIVSEPKSDKLVIDSFKKGKLKSKKIKFGSSSVSQEDMLRKKGKNKVISVNDLSISLEKSLKSHKPKRKQKVKRVISTSLNKVQADKMLVSDVRNSSKSVIINEPLSVHELAVKLQIPVAEIITMLFLKGIFATINQVIDISLCKQVIEHYDFVIADDVINQSVDSEKALDTKISNSALSRSPIIAILGHVDHGKTSILDAIKHTNLVTQEIGGITQGISVHEVNWLYNSSSKKLIFLDTPGHEAFAAMRLRSIQVADVVLLVVAADDGLKPQTIESIECILLRKVPCVIAINKIDKDDANPDYVRRQLFKYHLMDRDWGGNVPIIKLSALRKINIDELLTKICALTELLNLKTDPKQIAQGIVLDSYLDKTRGNVSTLIVENGILNIGDVVISGASFGKVKSISDTSGNKINIAQSSSVLEILGFSSTPQAGMRFQVVDNEKQAKRMLSSVNLLDRSYVNTKKILGLRIGLESFSKNDVKKLNLIIKAGTQGCIDAIMHLFSQISQRKVRLNVLASSLGDVSNSDVNLALTSQSLIISFNVDFSSHVQALAEKLHVSLSKFFVIYDLLDYIKKHMLDLIDAEYDKVLTGNAKVQTVFYVQKKCVAGCVVQLGKLKKHSSIDIYRSDKLICTTVITSIKRIKDDVNEVDAVNECGLMCKDYDLWQSGDFIKAYELTQKPKSL